MKILHIETSSINCSVAVSINNTIVSLIEKQEANIHASSITLFIEQALTKANIELKEIDAIAVGAGPGSYTGLRIGVSTAKGLCYALNIPLISCSSLYNLFERARSMYNNKDLQIIPLIDARRMEVYTCTYTSKGDLIEPVKAVIVDQETFLHQLEKKSTLFIGDGAAKVEALYQHTTSHIFIADVYPSAAFMLEEAIRKYERGDFENVAYFEPFYLKEFYFNK